MLTVCIRIAGGALLEALKAVYRKVGEHRTLRVALLLVEERNIALADVSALLLHRELELVLALIGAHFLVGFNNVSV